MSNIIKAIMPWVVVAVVCFASGWLLRGKQTIVSTSSLVTNVDTLWRHKFINRTQLNTRLFSSKIIDTVRVFRVFQRDSIIYIQRDSLNETEAPQILTISQKTYKDTIPNIGSYKATISGINFEQYPKLDSIDFYIKYPIITQTKSVVIKPKLSYGLQAGLGYGIVHKKPDVYVGVGVSYNF